MLDLKDEMKSEIKITGLIKSGGKLIVIEKGRKIGRVSYGGKCVKLQNLYANAK